MEAFCRLAKVFQDFCKSADYLVNEAVCGVLFLIAKRHLLAT